METKKTESSYEEKIGLKYYRNTSGFVGGVLRKKPEDFVVIELTNFEFDEYRSEKENEYDYLVVKIRAKNWDTNNLIHKLSNGLGISKKRISFAGTKDKRAITTQFFTLYDVSKEEINNLNIPNVEYIEFGLSNEEIRLGDLIGNKFKILLREIDSDEEINPLVRKLKREGVINYFGPQRFGETRPITHLVGKEIVKENYEEAVKIYLAETFPGESEEIKKKRNKIKNEWGEKETYKRGLKEIPNYLRYERSLLHHLYENPNDPVGALRRLPHNLLNLFIHAYQSYLFNKIINYRIEEDLSLNEGIEGDVVCYTDLETGIPNRKITERITKRNEQKIKEMIDEKKAYLTAPLFGKKTKLALGKMGEIEERVLNEENLELRDFEIKEIPEITSSGLRREITIFPKFDDVLRKNNSLLLEFSLHKGTYATSVLREFRGE